MIPRFPPTPSARECATSTAPAGADIDGAGSGLSSPTHHTTSSLENQPTGGHRTRNTHPVSDALTRHKPEADRSRCGVRPISRKRYDCGPWSRGDRPGHGPRHQGATQPRAFPQTRGRALLLHRSEGSVYREPEPALSHDPSSGSPTLETVPVRRCSLCNATTL